MLKLLVEDEEVMEYKLEVGALEGKRESEVVGRGRRDRGRVDRG